MAQPDVAQPSDLDQRLREVIEDGEDVLLELEATLDLRGGASSDWNWRRGIVVVTTRRVIFTWRRWFYRIVPLPWHGWIDWPLQGIEHVDYIVGGKVAVTAHGKTSWILARSAEQQTHERAGRELVSVIESAKHHD